MLYQYLLDRIKYNHQLLAPHPGVFYGHYPVKKNKKKNFSQRLVRSLKRSVNKIFKTQRREVKWMLKNVHENHQPLKSMSESELNNEIIEIKVALHKRGLENKLMCQAFAVIKEVASRELKMSHYDCQLQGGWIMMKGMIAEMNTGEGKTLTATLPVSCAAMANMPVHVVTVNDYLVQRDAELMRPVYERLGLTLGFIMSDMTEEQRQQAYRCDITYCTSQQLVFDYLRDRILLKKFNTELDFKLSS